MLAVHRTPRISPRTCGLRPSAAPDCGVSCRRFKEVKDEGLKGLGRGDRGGADDRCNGFHIGVGISVSGPQHQWRSGLGLWNSSSAGPRISRYVIAASPAGWAAISPSVASGLTCRRETRVLPNSPARADSRSRVSERPARQPARCAAPNGCRSYTGRPPCRERQKRLNRQSFGSAGATRAAVWRGPFGVIDSLP